MVTSTTDPNIYASTTTGTATPNTNATALTPEAYGTAFGNNGDIISVNDPLALANFLPTPAPQQVVQVPTTPTWAYWIGAAIALKFIFSQKGVL